MALGGAGRGLLGGSPAGLGGSVELGREGCWLFARESSLRPVPFVTGVGCLGLPEGAGVDGFGSLRLASLAGSLGVCVRASDLVTWLVLSSAF